MPHTHKVSKIHKKSFRENCILNKISQTDLSVTLIASIIGCTAFSSLILYEETEILEHLSQIMIQEEEPQTPLTVAR